MIIVNQPAITSTPAIPGMLLDRYGILTDRLTGISKYHMLLLDLLSSFSFFLKIPNTYTRQGQMSSSLSVSIVV